MEFHQRSRLGFLASIFANTSIISYNDLHVILMYPLAFSHQLMHANLLSNIAAR